MRQCIDCKFWNGLRADKEKQQASCQRFPPDPHFGFPSVQWAMGCGEHVPFNDSTDVNIDPNAKIEDIIARLRRSLEELDADLAKKGLKAV